MIKLLIWIQYYWIEFFWSLQNFHWYFFAIMYFKFNRPLPSWLCGNFWRYIFEKTFLKYFVWCDLALFCWNIWLWSLFVYVLVMLVSSFAHRSSAAYKKYAFGPACVGHDLSWTYHGYMFQLCFLLYLPLRFYLYVFLSIHFALCFYCHVDKLYC